MSDVRNLFLMIHGMVTNPLPEEPYGQYITFWNDLVKAKPELAQLFPHKPIKVEWGHQLLAAVPPNIASRPDQALTAAEQYVHKKVAFEEIRKTGDPNYKFTVDIGVPFLRNQFVNVRENVIIYGLGDVVYYCSEDGERQVRQVIYSQVLERLEHELQNAPADAVFVLHAFGHSLGVTVIHDFLYGLFNRDPNYEPDFPKQGDAATVELFNKWRGLAHTRLKLGALASAASQLPILFLRKNSLVRLFYEAQQNPQSSMGVLPSAIGLSNRGERGTQWKIFYDVDDVLGFSTRGLYYPNDMIEDIQVDSGAFPESAHSGYWDKRSVIEETAELVLRWAKQPVLNEVGV